MSDSKEGRVLAMTKAWGGLIHPYISIYSFGRRQHGASESLLMLPLGCLAREREADGKKEKNTDDRNHPNTFVLDTAALVALHCTLVHLE